MSRRSVLVFICLLTAFVLLLHLYGAPAIADTRGAPVRQVGTSTPTPTQTGRFVATPDGALIFEFPTPRAIGAEGPISSQELSALEKSALAVVKLNGCSKPAEPVCTHSDGSGIIVHPRGLILTALHVVIEDPDDLDSPPLPEVSVGLVEDADEPVRSRFRATVAAIDPDHDLALLTITPPDDESELFLPTLPIEEIPTSEFRTGDLRVMGFPQYEKRLKQPAVEFFGLTEDGAVEADGRLVGRGFSGGPLLVERQDRLHVAGIVFYRADGPVLVQPLRNLGGLRWRDPKAPRLWAEDVQVEIVPAGGLPVLSLAVPVHAIDLVDRRLRLVAAAFDPKQEQAWPSAGEQLLLQRTFEATRFVDVVPLDVNAPLAGLGPVPERLKIVLQLWDMDESRLLWNGEIFILDSPEPPSAATPVPTPTPTNTVTTVPTVDLDSIVWATVSAVIDATSTAEAVAKSTEDDDDVVIEAIPTRVAAPPATDSVPAVLSSSAGNGLEFVVRNVSSSGKFVTVDVEITNTADEQLTFRWIGVEESTFLLDELNAERFFPGSQSDVSPSRATTLKSGERIVGWVKYQLPDAEHPSAVTVIMPYGIKFESVPIPWPPDPVALAASIPTFDITATVATMTASATSTPISRLPLPLPTPTSTFTPRQSGKPPTSEVSSGESVTLNFLGPVRGAQFDLIEQQIEQWIDINPDIRVNLVEGPTSATDRYALYLNTFQTQSPDVDVVQIDVIWPGDLAEHLVDLNEYGAADVTGAHFPAIVTNNTVDGALVGLPWFTDGGLLYYRSDLLEKYGFDGPPATWAELEEMAQTIQDGERADGNQDFWGYVWQGKAYEGLTCDALEWVYSSGGGTIISPEKVITIDNEAAAAVLDAAASWVGTISPPGVTGFQEEQARAVWQGGNAAFMRNWPYAYSLGQADDSAIQGLFDVTSLPGAEAGQSAATLGGWQLAVSKYSSNPEAAAKFALWIGSEEQQKARALNLSLLPTIPALYEDAEIVDAVPFMSRLLPVFTNAVARPSTASAPQYNEVSTIFFSNVWDVLTGGQSGEDAVASIALELEDLLDYPAD